MKNTFVLPRAVVLWKRKTSRGPSRAICSVSRKRKSFCSLAESGKEPKMEVQSAQTKTVRRDRVLHEHNSCPTSEGRPKPRVPEPRVRAQSKQDPRRQNKVDTSGQQEKCCNGGGVPRARRHPCPCHVAGGMQPAVCRLHHAKQREPRWRHTHAH